jgi:hypothetical protein
VAVTGKPAAVCLIIVKLLGNYESSECAWGERNMF